MKNRILILWLGSSLFLIPLKPQAFLNKASLNRKIEAFLLSKEIIPLLEERVNSSATGK